MKGNLLEIATMNIEVNLINLTKKGSLLNAVAGDVERDPHRTVTFYRGTTRGRDGSCCVLGIAKD